MRAKSVQLKQNQGTLERSRLNLEHIEFDLLERIPTAPSDWPLPAQAVWRDTCTWLKNVDMMCSAFTHTIAEYSWAVYECERARIELKSKPNDMTVHKRLDMNSKRAERLAVKLGLSPLDSQKVKPRPRPQPITISSLMR